MIRIADISDITWMVNLSYQKRLEYSKIQPCFWKMTENSNKIQTEWFKEELQNRNVIALCCNDGNGFIIGKLVNPPEVYDAGLTLIIDDFCVKSSNLWMTFGKELLQKCIKSSKEKSAKQVFRDKLKEVGGTWARCK